MRDPALANGFYWAHEPWGRTLRSTALAALADHFFTSLPLRLRGDRTAEKRDWDSVAASIGVAPSRLLRLKQVHGHRVIVARAAEPLPSLTDASSAPSFVAEADILLSDDPSVALAIQVADCVPLLVADRATCAVAAAHAGWRGTAANVAAITVEGLAREFGSQAANLVAVHGPSIGPCCYEVGEELVGKFGASGFGAAVNRWFSADGVGSLRLDLWRANRDQLEAAGVTPENIHQAGLCTAHHPRLFPSYRRDGKGTGRIAAVIRAPGRSVSE